MQIHDKPFVDIDFEFHDSNDYRPNIVCCSVRDSETRVTESFWTYNDEDTKQDLRNYLYARKHTHIMRGYMCIAEARSFLAIDIEDAKEFEWVDLYCEWVMAINHNDHLAYGKHLNKGKEIKTFPPKSKWEATAADKKKNSAKPEKGLAAATYKLLGVKIDTDRKKKMRDILISGNSIEIEKHGDEIIEYCESDIKYLPQIYKKLVKEYKRLYRRSDFKHVAEDMLYRGNYSARTAYIERLGEPMNVEWARNFSGAVPSILRDIQVEINQLFPDMKPFRYRKKDGAYTWNQIRTKEWIRTLDPHMVESWDRTPGGDLSLSLDAFLKFFNYHHDFPKDILGAQIVRYLKMKQNLNGFLPGKEGKKTFFDSIGSDNRSRPFLGIYGSQSGRNQPAATGFLFLKSAWMRSLSEPPIGRCCVDIDYSSEEFLVGGLESGDMAMIAAYHSGDPYLYFAKAAGAVPEWGTKKTHGPMRNKFKAVVLAMSYGMRSKGMALKLTADTGETHTPEMAQEFIDLFEMVFPVYTEFRNNGIIDQYDTDEYLRLSDGWTMFGDNPNNLSVSNFPSQGKGSVILRKMVAYLQDSGLDVIRTLHDAGYIEIDWGDWAKVDTFFEQMAKAFYDSYEGHPLQEQAIIRIEGECWSRDFATEDDGRVMSHVDEDGETHYTLTTPGGREVPCQEIYIDGRAVKEHSYFSHYFLESVHDKVSGL